MKKTIVALGLVLAACHGGGPSGSNEAPTTGASGVAATSAPSASETRSRSVYALPMTLTDQDGAKVGLDVFRGKPVLLAMFYASCPSACPLLVSTIRRVMSRLDERAAAEARVLLVSFDPQNDTPDALRRLATERGLDARWKLASAPADQVRDLAAVLGIQYRPLPDGGFNHTSSIVLLDRSGVIDTRLDDMAAPLDPLVARIGERAKP